MKKQDSAAIKGVAILIMMFHHCYRVQSKFAGRHVIFDPFAVNDVVRVANYMKICVSLFAFVSGFGLMYGFMHRKKKGLLSAGRWTIQHLISTTSGFWVVAGLSYFVIGFERNFNYHSWGGNSFEIARNIFFDCLGISELTGTKSLNGAWWYMGTAIGFILFMPLLAWLTEKIGGLSTILLIMLLPRVIGWWYLGGKSSYSFLTILEMGAIFQYYDVFPKIEKFLNSGRAMIRKSVTGIVLFLLIPLTVYSYTRVEMELYWEYCYCWIPMVLILFCVLYLFKVKAISVPLQFFGKYSLNIWLVHTFLRDKVPFVWSVRIFWLVPVVIFVIALGISILIELLKKYTGYNDMIKALQKCFADKPKAEKEVNAKVETA